MITGGKLSTRPPDLMRRPLRHRLPVRGWIPTIRHARAEGTPSAISFANASRFALSGLGPRRPIATPQAHGCCSARQIPPERGEGFAGGEIYLSFPGLGDRLAARVAGEIGDHPEMFASPNGLQCCAGKAPVTRRSGKHELVVSTRLACNGHLRDAVQPPELTDRGLGQEADRERGTASAIVEARRLARLGRFRSRREALRTQPVHRPFPGESSGLLGRMGSLRCLHPICRRTCPGAVRTRRGASAGVAAP